jgi:hypothetical protein
MNTYNIYECVCKYLFDCNHSITVDLKVICPDCGRILEHTYQVDFDTLEELSK